MLRTDVKISVIYSTNTGKHEEDIKYLKGNTNLKESHQPTKLKK